MYYGEPEEDGYGFVITAGLVAAVIGFVSTGATIGGGIYLSKKEKEAQAIADAEAMERLEAQAKADADAREDETVIEKLKGKFWTKTIKTAGAVAVASTALWWAFREKK